MSKTNAVSHKGVFLTHEALGTSGVNLINCGRDNLEVSSVSSLPIENSKEAVIQKEIGSINLVLKHGMSLCNG